MSKQYFYLDKKNAQQIGVKQNFSNDTYIIAINDRRIILNLWDKEDLKFLEDISNVIRYDIMRIKKEKASYENYQRNKT